MPDTSDEPIYTLLKQRHAPDYPEQDLRLLAYELKQLQNQAIRAELLSIIGEDDVKKPNSDDYDDWTVCDTCDVILDDLTSPEYACICDRRNELRKELRQQVISRYGAEDGGDE